MKKKHLTVLFLSVFILTQSLYGDEDQFKWSNLTGKWKTLQDKAGFFLYEPQCNYRNWNYNELINFNSISTFNSYKDYDLYKFSFRVTNPINTHVELMFFFALKNFRNFYAFKYIVEKENSTEIQFINSKITDTSLNPAVKNNFTISVLNSKKSNFEFDKNYNIEIKIIENKAELFINGKKEMEANTPEKLNSGKLGFSSRNVQIRIENVKVYNKENIVFEDDFSVDSIKRWKVRAKRVKSED